jgi:hypothetical protein
MIKNSFLTIFAVLLFQYVGSAQITKADYQRADSTDQYPDMVFNDRLLPQWVSEQAFWYKINTRKGDEYFLVDAEKVQKKVLFDQEKLVKELTKTGIKDLKPYSIPLKNIKLKLDEKTIAFELEGYLFQCKLPSCKVISKEKKEEKKEKYVHWTIARDELSNDPVVSPDSSYVAFIRECNVWIRNQSNQEETQLSFDGSPGELYSSFMEWSPDSKKLTTHKVRLNKKRYINYVEAAPKDQLQPRLHTLEYLKPGDAVPIFKPSLFHVEKQQQVPVDASGFEDQYFLTAIKWYKDSRAFHFEYNQRGHQQYQYVEVDANSGDIRVVIDETSPTFISYYYRIFHHNVDDGKEMIWMSERDGWNHLYLYDGITGEVKNQITKGEWVVRSVDKVDEKNRQIYFQGSGMNPGEDPYYIHYYRINFDGSGLVDLTPGNYHHQAVFSDDYQYLVDHYSRINVPPVSVLRRASDGEILMTLEEADVKDLMASGYTMPEVFVAKGRDGETDIWGNIYYPSNFDSTKRYPVIEYIYAGPHDSYVQKSFRPYFYWITGLSELGFIVVSIDGMGTSNRSKAFHDVCWKNLKDAGFPDRKIWITEAAKKYSYMDISNMGIYGSSAGGQNSMAALLFHPDFYNVAVSSCGCHDNRMDKIWWNEQWLGYPIGKAYEENSNVVNAHQLEGKLMLILGEVDNNVDPASTMQVVDALIKADKEFEFVMVPGMGHSIGTGWAERKRRDFFVRHILKCDPPNWNE